MTSRECGKLKTRWSLIMSGHLTILIKFLNFLAILEIFFRIE